MPFSEPFRPQDQIDSVRKVGRLAQIILDLRMEYERKPRRDLLDQLVARIGELNDLRDQILASPSYKQPADEEQGRTARIASGQ